VLEKNSNKVLDFALENEIEATLDANLALWNSLPANKRGKKPMSYLDWASLPPENWPVVTLTVSFDTGWQTKGTGKNYNSLSGHSFMVGAYTRKVLSCLVKSKMCKICNLAENKKFLHLCMCA
jgi:hypothetical protein